MQNQNNLQHPYAVSLHKNNYTFSSHQGVFYVCGFDNITSKLSPVVGIYDMEVYDFVFFSHDETDTRKAKDNRVSATVIQIMRDFFDSSSRVLLYVCDNSDGRSRERQTLFKHWHKNISDVVNRNEVELDLDTPDGINKLYGGILTRKDFQHMDILINELFDPVRGIMIEKFNQ